MRFSDEADVEVFLSENLQVNVSTTDDVQEFMEINLVSEESCTMYAAPDLPESVTSSWENYDAHLICFVLSRDTWPIYLTRRWYAISFIFYDGLLREFQVGRTFQGL